MVTYYAKRALEIPREEGPFELYKRARNYPIRKSIRKYSRRVLLETQKIRLRVKYGSSAPDPYNLIYINPREIKYYRYMPHVVKNKLLNLDAWYGTFIIGGSWDKKPEHDEFEDHHRKMKFEDYYLWKATVEHFKEGKDWENTSFFEEYNRSLESYQRIEKLYNIIQSEGYKNQREMEDGYDKYFMPPEYDEIRVNIGRDGEIYFDDGRHRFCALKMLDIDTKIPVRVYVRHKQWQELRDEVHNNGLPEGREDLRDHPDLQDVLN